MDNGITLCGNITAEPTLRYTAAGTPVTSFDIAANRRWTDPQSGEVKEKTTFCSVQVWRNLAENLADSCQKGQRVVVTGRLDQNTWEADDGTKRSKLRIVADDVGVSLMFGQASFVKVDRKREAQVAAATTEETVVEDPTAGEAPPAEEPF